MTQPDGGGPGAGPSLPSLPEDAAGRAFDVLAGLGEAFNEFVYGVGRQIADILPVVIDVGTALI